MFSPIKEREGAVIGVGVDVAETARIEDALKKGRGFAARVFTAAERRYCSKGVRPAERYAARFAAKEATLKALGVGWARGAGFLDVEVVRAANGAPSIKLRGRAAEIANESGVARVLISLSHSGATALAFAVAVGARPADSDQRRKRKK